MTAFLRVAAAAAALTFGATDAHALDPKCLNTRPMPADCYKDPTPVQPGTPPDIVGKPTFRAQSTTLRDTPANATPEPPSVLPPSSAVSPATPPAEVVSVLLRLVPPDIRNFTQDPPGACRHQEFVSLDPATGNPAIHFLSRYCKQADGTWAHAPN